MQIQGRIEVFAQREGLVYVAGWFRAPEIPLPAGMARLVVTWGEVRRELPLRRLRERRDLPAKDGQPAGRGFQVLLPIPEGLEAGQAASVSLTLGEEAVQLTPSPLEPTPLQPRGGLDEQDRQGVSGWVVTIPGEKPVLRFGGHEIPVALTLHRPDLPFDDGSENPLFGFRLPMEALIGVLRQHVPDDVLFDGTPRDLVLAVSGMELARFPLTLRREMLGRRARQVQGHIEVFARRGRFLYVAGWFRAPEERLAEGPPSLAITWGTERREMPLRRLRERRDLPRQGEQAAGFGFQLLVEAPETEEPASASLLLGREEAPITPVTLEASPFRPRGGMDRPDRNGVAGWVVNAPGEQPAMLLEGCNPIPLQLNLPRPDLIFDDGTERPLLGFFLPLEALAAALRDDVPHAALFDGRPRELVLVASGVELARSSLALRRDMLGKLERAEEGEATGWVAERGRPQDPQAIDLVLDGTRWTTVHANIPRPDLARHDIAHRGGGFRAALPSFHPGEGGPLRIEAVPRYTTEPLPGATVQEAMPAWRRDRGEVSSRLPPDGRVPVAIVVPVHNAAAELDRCIASVVRHTTAPARLILLDDASTQPEVADVLQRWEGTPWVEIHRNDENLGFTRTANRGIVLAGRDDVVLLNSDTVVGPGWLDGLRAAARSGPRTGTATAVSNNAGAFSVPEFNAANGMPSWFGVEEMARLVRGAALSLYPAVPTGHGFCLYLRRDCLDSVGTLDEEAFPRGYGEENDLCMRAARAGFENVLDDRTFVWHQRSASFGAEKVTLNASGRAVLEERYPEYRTLTRMFETDATMLAVRWRVRRAVAQVRAAGNVPRPRVLFVISTESGGTPQTNRDLMDALADRYEPWVLGCDSRTLTLARHRPGLPAREAAELVETHRLERPIEPATHRSGEYDRLVGDMVLRHGFELVHIRHIAWHGIGLAETCRRLGVPVIFSFHDFYTACPTTKLLDAEGRFCGGACTRGEGGDCKAELWPAGAMPPLRDRFVHRWQAMMGEALQACDAFVTTSPAARDTLVANFPSLADRDFRVIPHGRDFARMEMLAAEPTLDERLRVLVPGNVSASKGGGLVAAMAALDRGREVEFHVLGAVDSSLADAPGLVLHGRYERAEFAAHVARIRPHLGAVLSLWPETYCHTLTECWATGLPVMATALGALAERMTENPGGWLVDRWMPPEEMLAMLHRLRRQPAELRARRDVVLDWQATTGRHRDSAAMAVEYDRLYREVLDRRRAFGVAPTRPRVVLTLDRPGGALPTPLAAATRNAVSRPFVFRRISPSFPFGEPAVGHADAVLVAPDALAPGDLAALHQRCAELGLPVMAAVTEGAAGQGEEDLSLGHGLEETGWLSDAEDGPATPAETGMPCCVLCVSDGDEALLPALRPVFEDLAALGVATLSVLGAPPGGGEWFRTIDPGPRSGVAILRHVAREHRIGLACAGPMTLALQAAGLPVLPIPPGLLDAAPGRARRGRQELLRGLAELATDAPRRVAMARESAALARVAMAGRSAGQETDLRLGRMLAREKVRVAQLS